MGVALVIVYGFVNGVRGTFAYHRLNPGEARSLWSHLWRAAGWALLLVVALLMGAMIGSAAVGVRIGLHSVWTKAYSPPSTTVPDPPPLLHPMGLGHGLQISLPSEWVIDKAQKAHDSVFFVAVLRDASGELLADINIQDGPDLPMSQAGCAEMSIADLKQFDDASHAAVAKRSGKTFALLEWQGSRIESISGKLAIRSDYKMRIRSGEVMQTSGLLFPLGNHSLTMTLGYNVNAGGAAKRGFDEALQSFRLTEDPIAR